jgi:hypothetical protein
MRIPMSLPLWLVLGGLAGIPRPAAADLTLTLSENGASRTMLLTNDKVWADDGAGKVMFFDANEDVLRLLDTSAKTYGELTRADLEAMRQRLASLPGGSGAPGGQGQPGGSGAAGTPGAGAGVGAPGRGDAPDTSGSAAMATAMKRMQEILAKIPEDERKMVEDRMRSTIAGNPGMPPDALPGGTPSALPGGAAGTLPAGGGTTYEPMGETKPIRNLSCRGFKAMRDGRQTGEVWTTSLEEMGLSVDDFAAMTKLSSFLQAAMEGLGPLGRLPNARLFDPADPAFPGVPILQIRYGAEGKPQETTELTSWKKGAIEKKLQVPEGFKKEEGFLQMSSGSR